MSFETDFAGMIPDTLIYDTVTRDETGALVASGSPSSVSCYIEEETLLVTGPGGKEVVSTVQVYVDLYSLTVENHVYTIPSRFSPNTDREAVAVEHLSNEDGAYAEIVMF